MNLICYKCKQEMRSLGIWSGRGPDIELYACDKCNIVSIEIADVDDGFLTGDVAIHSYKIGRGK